MAIYCGVDFHARQQTVCYCDTASGEVHLRELDHEGDNVRGFYSAFSGEVIVGIEASGYSTWFAELIESLGHRGMRCKDYLQAQKWFEYPLLSGDSEQALDERRLTLCVTSY